MSFAPETPTTPALGRSNGLTFLALGAVLGLLVFLFLFATPSLVTPRESVWRSRCVHSLKTIGLALQTYHDQHKSFPPAIVTDDQGRPMHSWRVLILPYFEDAELAKLYEQYRFDEPWDGPYNSMLHDQVAQVFHCAADVDNKFETNYLAVVDEQTIWPGTATVKMREITDGTSRTIAVVETADSGIHWLEPRDLSLNQAMRGINPMGPGPAVRSRHAGGAHVLFSDGSVHSLSDDVPPATLRALLTARGGEDVEIPDY